MPHTPTPLRRRVATTTAVIGSVSLALSTTPAAAAVGAAPASGLRLAVSVPPPHPALRQAAVAVPAEYTIEAGDTISDIAARFGLRTADVLAANGLDWSSIIQPGQRIVLDASAGAPAATAAPDASAAPVAPLVAAATHTIVAGDTLWAIAASAGVSVGDLLAANGLGEGAIIYPGQTLLVPAPGAASAVAAAAAPLEATRMADVTPAPASAPAPAVTLDAEQSENARVIIRVGRDLGVPERGIAIALATAMVESWVRNLDWGDRDSLGLFQQRPSMGWGTPDELLDPSRAATAFYLGTTTADGARTHGLLDIDGWESMEFGAAAQAVQISAYPERYGVWERDAYAWLAALG